MWLTETGRQERVEHAPTGVPVKAHREAAQVPNIPQGPLLFLLHIFLQLVANCNIFMGDGQQKVLEHTPEEHDDYNTLCEALQKVNFCIFLNHLYIYLVPLLGLVNLYIYIYILFLYLVNLLDPKGA